MKIAGQHVTDMQNDNVDYAEETYLNADNIQEKKDQFYVTGLLHDIGRVAQYETGEHHSVAGVRIAEKLLTEIGYRPNGCRKHYRSWVCIMAGEETEG